MLPTLASKGLCSSLLRRGWPMHLGRCEYAISWALASFGLTRVGRLENTNGTMAFEKYTNVHPSSCVSRHLKWVLLLARCSQKIKFVMRNGLPGFESFPSDSRIFTCPLFFVVQAVIFVFFHCTVSAVV